MLDLVGFVSPWVRSSRSAFTFYFFTFFVGVSLFSYKIVFQQACMIQRIKINVGIGVVPLWAISIQYRVYICRDTVKYFYDCCFSQHLNVMS